MIRRIVLSLSLCSALAAPAPEAHAQGVGMIAYTIISGAAIVRLIAGKCCADVQVGSTVRVTDRSRSFGSPTSFTGVVTAVDADSFTVATGDATWRGARADSSDVKVRVREAKWAQGWRNGLFIGGGVGGILGLMSAGDDTGWFSGDEMIVIGLVAGAVVGSGAGAVFGALKTGDAWSSVRSFSAAPILQPLIAARGARVGLRISFR